MRSKPTILVSALAFVLTLLAVATLTYRSTQETLTREANSLYSSDAFVVSGDFTTAFEVAQRDGLELQIFMSLSEDDKIRAVISTKATFSEAATHDLDWVPSDDHPGALVGAEVDVSSGQVDVAGKLYPVAGRLGMTAKSLLAPDILLYAPDLFEYPAVQRFVIDGAGAEKVTEFFNDATPIGDALSRRTNVDFVSPLIIALSVILLTLGSALTGYLAFSWGQSVDRVQRIWGRSRVQILGRRIALHGSVWASISLLVSLALAWFGAPGAVIEGYWPASALLWAVFMAVFVGTFVSRKRGL